MTLTASRIELAMRCRGAFTLPHDNTRNVFSDAGVERHAEDEQAIGRGEIPPILAETWPGFDWHAEVAMAYDTATGEGRSLGQGIDREYGNLSPFEIAGTADAIGRKGDRLVIFDKKGFDEVTRAAENPQVRFLALAASRIYKAKHVEVATGHMLRGLDRADLDAFDLDETAQSVRQTMLDVAKAQHDARNGLPVEFATGRWCRWCPAFAACPRQSELMVLVKSDAIENRIENSIPFNDDESAADAYELAKRIRMLLKRIDASLYARAGERPFAIGNGKMFGPVEKLGNEKLSGDVVYEVVKSYHGQDIADAAVQRTTSKTKIREALGFVGGKGQVAALERKLLEEVRARGGSERLLKIEIGEYEPTFNDALAAG